MRREQLSADEGQLPPQLGDEPTSRTTWRAATLMHNVKREAEVPAAVLGDIENLQSPSGNMCMNQVSRHIAPAEAVE